MEMVCQPSYPLNSENASPFGTFRVYLSWAEIAAPVARTASATVIPTVINVPLLVIAAVSFYSVNEHPHTIKPCMLNRVHCTKVPFDRWRANGSGTPTIW